MKASCRGQFSFFFFLTLSYMGARLGYIILVTSLAGFVWAVIIWQLWPTIFNPNICQSNIVAVSSFPGNRHRPTILSNLPKYTSCSTACIQLAYAQPILWAAVFDVDVTHCLVCLILLWLQSSLSHEATGLLEYSCCGKLWFLHDSMLKTFSAPLGVLYSSLFSKS